MAAPLRCLTSRGLTMDVANHYELLALLRAIMEAKFAQRRTETEIVGSPHLAAVANRIVDSLISLEIKTNPSAGFKWQTWRTLSPTRREWRIIVRRIREVTKWNNWSLEERNAYIDYLISPLQISTTDRQLLLNLCAKKKGTA
jgi:hypothetical protein